VVVDVEVVEVLVDVVDVDVLVDVDVVEVLVVVNSHAAKHDAYDVVFILGAVPGVVNETGLYTKPSGVEGLYHLIVDG
jgi:hypothetical protein